DSFFGDAGFDIAAFTRPQGDYTMSRSGGVVTFTSIDGDTSLKGVERVTFGDGTLLNFGGSVHATGGDFNGDGRDHVLWRHDIGPIAAWLMNGANVVGGGLVGPGTAPNGWQIAGGGDFNGDGRDDILWRNDNGQIATWMLNGTGLVGGGLIGPGSAPN